MKYTTCMIKDERYKAAAKVLDKWRFIYEILPSGNLRAEPMDFSINERLCRELSKAGYFVLEGGYTGNRFLVVSPVREDEKIFAQ